MSDLVIVGGGFTGTVAFGTGPDDEVTLTNSYDMHNSILLRFDREAE
jgi:hypothetical protein